jgi:hypothetical protein
LNLLLRAIAQDYSIFGVIARRAIKHLPIVHRDLSLREKLRLGQFPRTRYAYCVTRAAQLAVRLGYNAVSVLEFGVAGGNGLVALEEIKRIIENHMTIDVRIFGFDLGNGLPSPRDYRDLPYHWQTGFYEMDVDRLRNRITSAKLIIGPISQTIREFISVSHETAPVGMIAFDLDYYSSTAESFAVFEMECNGILPRVMCYMDDVIGVSECFSDFTGERLAIDEFNETHAKQKISRCYDFGDFRIERWQEQVMIYHDFSHPLYDRYVGDEADTQLPLT